MKTTSMCDIFSGYGIIAILFFFLNVFLISTDRANGLWPERQRLVKEVRNI